MLKKYLSLWLSLLILSSCYSYALEKSSVSDPTEDTAAPFPLSGTFEVTSNYLSEGLSNTNNAPAIQAGLTYTWIKTGLYFNIWGTNADFIAPQDRHATVEFDTILGISNPINNDWSYDFYLDHYHYPGAAAADYTDLILALTYKIFTATTYYSGNVYGSHGTGIYINGAINYLIPEKIISIKDLSVLAAIGYYHLAPESGVNNYYNAVLGLQKIVKNFTFTLEWTDTAQANLPPFDGFHMVGTVLYSF